jgi:hypothetical protein
MSKAGNRLVLAILTVALAAGLLTSVFVRPEPKLTASEECYGPCQSVTKLSLSNVILIYGREEFEHFYVRARAEGRGRDVLSGQVEVRSGTRVLCTIHLSFGMGSCSLSARELAPGLHEIVAHYSGGKGFKASTSIERIVFVVRHPIFGLGRIRAADVNRSHVKRSHTAR